MVQSESLKRRYFRSWEERPEALSGSGAVRMTSASSRTVHTLAWSQSSSSVSGVATSTTARTLSNDTSPAQSDPTRWGRP